MRGHARRAGIERRWEAFLLQSIISGAAPGTLWALQAPLRGIPFL